ncbi:MAG TPA: tRNA (adenosine(37)-N6)-dimethylallyltransferase MiaA [Aeromicrobium sp.]|nr:tRNA (adenosine(37)-N6)-dimethylallyltransferase MiaA [Aeromicrobium sp.]
MKPPTPLLVIVGPTASGKTKLSVDIALATGGEIVNADSVQLYAGMDIGSAKATLVERRGVAHHLLDVLDVTSEASVAQFQQLARSAIDSIQARGAPAILVGGSSLYVRAVIDPLDFPGTDPAVRAKWTEELQRLGASALHQLLAERDPAAAAQILPTNGRRIVRALEVGEITGEPFVATLPDYLSIFSNLTMVGLDVDRAVLDERIDQRVDQMWADGLVGEVESLPGLAGSRTASRALGYQQVLAYLAGDLTADEARAEIKSGTKKFARRQDRMMRKDPRIHWIEYDASNAVEQVLSLVDSAPSDLAP